MPHTWAIDSVRRLLAFGAPMLCCNDGWKNLAYLIAWLSKGSLFSRYLVQLLRKQDTASSECFLWRVSICDLTWVLWSILSWKDVLSTQPSVSNMRKKGKISEDLTREYVSFNHYSYKRAEWGRNLGTDFQKLKWRRYWWIYKMNKVSGI